MVHGERDAPFSFARVRAAVSSHSLRVVCDREVLAKIKIVENLFLPGAHSRKASVPRHSSEWNLRLIQLKPVLPLVGG